MSDWSDKTAKEYFGNWATFWLFLTIFYGACVETAICELPVKILVTRLDLTNNPRCREAFMMPAVVRFLPHD